MFERISDNGGALRPLSDLRGIEPVPAGSRPHYRPTPAEKGEPGSMDHGGRGDDSADITQEARDLARHDPGPARPDEGDATGAERVTREPREPGAPGAPGEEREPGVVDSSGPSESENTVAGEDVEESPSAADVEKQTPEPEVDPGEREATRRAVSELRRRDADVRAHEQAHSGVGGALAGAPQYTYQRGPDGRAYVVGGEVSIRLQPGNTPEETLRNAEQARRAALAPARPSAQDQRVAGEAQRLADAARREKLEASREGTDTESGENQGKAGPGSPSGDDARVRPELPGRPELSALPGGTIDLEELSAREEERVRLVERAIEAYNASRGRRDDGSVSLLA